MAMESSLSNGVLYIENVTIADIVSYIAKKHDNMEFNATIKEQVLGFISRRRKKGIFIQNESDGIQIDIFLMFDDISAYLSKCTLLQEEIKREVEWMTGLTVKEINIHIVKLREKR